MSDVKRFMIIISDMGFGHRSASLAVEAALKEKHGEQAEIVIVNPLDDKRAPFWLRDSQTDYDKWVRNVPELYRFGFNASDSVVPTAIMESVLTVSLAEIMNDLLKQHRPDAVLVAYPLFQAPLVSLPAVRRRHLPVYTVVTDLTSVHRMWFNKRVTGCFVPTALTAELALANGIPAEKVRVTGVPANLQVVHETRSADEIRAELGWQPGLTTLLAVGSRRVERLLDMMDIVNHFGAPLQLAVVAGKDETLFNELKAVHWHIPVHIYEYVENIPTLMKASDLVICKAGGLIVTESLACGKPMILIDVIPGQETGNADYVLEHGAAELSETPLTFLQSLSHLLHNDGELLKDRGLNARALGRPQAAFEVADVLWEAAVNAPAAHNRRNSRRLSRFLETLDASREKTTEENPPA